MINEIVSRVSKKVLEMESKPRILILTNEHGESCHSVLESAKLNELYSVECALTNYYKCDVNNYEAIVVYNLTNDVLSKLAAGINDTSYLKLVSQAILNGKKIYVPVEEVELYKYKETSPWKYYSMMEAKIDFLKECGIEFYNKECIEDVIINGKKTLVKTAVVENKAVINDEKDAEVHDDTEKSVTFTKKVITEKNIVSAHSSGALRIIIGKNSILTDLAKDYAHNKKIMIERN